MPVSLSLFIKYFDNFESPGTTILAECNQDFEMSDPRLIDMEPGGESTQYDKSHQGRENRGC